jgi:hypothetical protein
MTGISLRSNGLVPPGSDTRGRTKVIVSIRGLHGGEGRARRSRRALVVRESDMTGNRSFQ